MKFATYDDGSIDGRLIVVSRIKPAPSTPRRSRRACLARFRLARGRSRR